MSCMCESQHAPIDMLYDCEWEILTENKIENIYSLCGIDVHGKVTILLTYYSDNDASPKKAVSLYLGENGTYEVYKVDNEHNGELIETTDNLSFDLDLFTMVIIKEK